MINRLLIAVFLIIPLLTPAQDYPPALSSGEIPNDITRSTLKAIQAKIDTLNLADTNYQNKKDFYSVSVYGNAKYLRSGKIIFNDEYSDYVKSVLDSISKYNNGIFDGFRVYIVRDASANAMVGDEGCIFVHIGLLARVENEAQLAFILCHEIIHKQHSHSLKGYIKEKDVDKMYEENEDLDYTDQFFTKAGFSRENETEADVDGMKLFENTPYSMVAVKDVFDVLLYSYLPPEMKPIDFTAFEDKYYQIPDMFIIEKTNPIQANDNYYDSLSSHPNIKKRREFIHKELKDVDSTGAFNLVGEDQFLKVQHSARKEMIKIQLESFKYMQAFYNANMLQYHPKADTVFSQKMQFLALYGMCMISNDVGKERFIYPTRYSQGDFHQWHEFLYDLNEEELFAFSMRFGYEYVKNYPHTKWDEERLKQLLFVFTTEQEATLDAYALTIPNDADVIDINYVEPDTTKADTAKKTTSQSKYDAAIQAKRDKINRRKDKKEESEKEVRKRGTIKGYSWQESALTTYGQDSLFKAFVKEMKDQIKEEKRKLKEAEIEQAKIDAANKGKTDKEIEAEAKEKARLAKAENESKDEEDLEGFVDTLLVTDAFFSMNNPKLDPYYLVQENVQGEEYMAGSVTKQAEKADLYIDGLFSTQFDSNEVADFNDRAILKSWFLEMLMSEVTEFIPSTQETMDSIAIKRNCKNAAFTYVECEDYKKGFLFRLMFPQSISNFSYVNVAIIVMDVESRKVIADRERTTYYKSDKELMDYLYYRNFESIKYKMKQDAEE